jgi:hypothetical protein
MAVSVKVVILCSVSDGGSFLSSLSRMRRILKAADYAARTIARPFSWALLAGTGQVLLEDQLRIGPRHSEEGWGSDTALAQALSGAVSGSLVALVTDVRRMFPSHFVGALNPAVGIVYYAVLGGIGGLLLPAVRALFYARGAKTLMAPLNATGLVQDPAKAHGSLGQERSSQGVVAGPSLSELLEEAEARERDRPR